MKKSIILPILAAFLALSLTACKTPDSTSSVSTDSSSQTTAELSSADTSSQETSSAPAESSEVTSSKASSKVTSSKKTSSKKSSKPTPSKVTPSKTTSSKAVSSKTDPPITKTGLELFRAADKNYQKWTDQAITAKTTQTLEMTDGSLRTTNVTEISAATARKNNAEHMQLDMKMKFVGQSLESSFYTDGTRFVAKKPGGAWTEISEEEVAILLESLEMLGGSAETNNNIFGVKLNQDTVKKQTVEWKNGKYAVHFELNASAIEDPALLPDEEWEGDPEMPPIEMQITEFSFDLVISTSNQLESAKLTIRISEKINNAELRISSVTDYTFRQIKPDELVTPDILLEQAETV